MKVDKIKKQVKESVTAREWNEKKWKQKVKESEAKSEGKRFERQWTWKTNMKESEKNERDCNFKFSHFLSQVKSVNLQTRRCETHFTDVFNFWKLSKNTANLLLV
jgi:hypothetical protein